MPRKCDAQRQSPLLRILREWTQLRMRSFYQIPELRYFSAGLDDHHRSMR